MPPKRLKPVEGGGAKVPKIPHYASPKAQKQVKSRLTPREKTWQDVDAGPAWLTQTGRDSPTFFQSKTYKLIDAIYNPPATKPPQQVSISPPPLGRLHVKRNQMKAMHEALMKPENLRSGKRVTLAELAREQGKGRKDSSLGPGAYSPVHRCVEKQVGGYGSVFPKAATGREPAPLSERDSDEDSPTPKSVPPVELDRHLKKHVPVHSWKRATGRNTHIPWNISVDFRREERLIARQEKVRRRRMNRLAKVRRSELEAAGDADVEEGDSDESSSEEEEVKMIAPGVKPKPAAKEGKEEEDGGESESPSEGASPDPDGESPNALFNLGESSGSSSSSAQRRRRRRRRKRAAGAVKKADLEPVLVFGDHSDSGSISSTETERARRTKRSKAERRRRIARMKGPDFESVPGREELWKAQHASAAPDVPYQVKYDLVERDSKKSIKITDPQAREWANALSVGGEGKVSINIDTIVEDYTKGFYTEHKKYLEESCKPQRRQSHAVVGKGKGHHLYDVNSSNPHLPWNHPPVVSPFELMAGKPRQPTPQQGPQHPRPQIGTGDSDDEHRPLQMALDELVQEGSLFSQLKELVPPEAMVRSTWPAPTASRLGISKQNGLPRIRQSLHNRQHGKGRLQILQEFLVETQETTTRRNREERRRLPKLPWQKDPPPVPLLEYCADTQPPDPPPSGMQEGGPPREGQGGGGPLGLPPRSRSQRRSAAEGRESRGSAAGSIRSRGTSQGDGGMESLIEAMAGRHALESQGSMQTALHQMALYGRSTSPLREGEEDALADLVGSSSFRASRCSTNMSVSASALVDLANIVEGETISSRNSPVSTLRSTHLGDFLRANSRGSAVGGTTGDMASPTNQSTPPATFSPSAQDPVPHPFPEP